MKNEGDQGNKNESKVKQKKVENRLSFTSGQGANNKSLTKSEPVVYGRGRRRLIDFGNRKW